MKKATVTKGIKNLKKAHLKTTEVSQVINSDADLKLVDIHRIIPRTEGGTYTEENTVVLDPTAHMEEHGNLRIRTPEEEELKEMLDNRTQILKIVMKISNQLDAYERLTDHLNKDTIEFLNNSLLPAKKKLEEVDKKVKAKIKEMAKTNPLIKAAINIKGLGEITIAYLVIYVDLVKARRASCVWSYAGLAVPSHERYDKKKAIADGTAPPLVIRKKKNGENAKQNTTKTNAGSMKLRTALYNFASSQIKSRGAYRYIYDNTKNRLENSQKITKTRLPGKKGVFEKRWMDVSDGHRHGSAIRQMNKVLLYDWWYVGRTLLGLDTSPAYPETQLGGEHKTSYPNERGWVYDDKK